MEEDTISQKWVKEECNSPSNIQKPKKRSRSVKQQEAFKRCQQKRAENARIRAELKEIKDNERLGKMMSREKDKLRKKAKLSKAKKSIKAHHQKTRQRKTTAPKKQKQYSYSSDSSISSISEGSSSDYESDSSSQQSIEVRKSTRIKHSMPGYNSYFG